MVSLRTSDGLDLQMLEENFGTELKLYCLKNIKMFIESKKVYCFDNKLRLSADGIQISNLILTQIMKV
jgi:oxygen-independent coproporphyrinogen-3 oxidase